MINYFHPSPEDYEIEIPKSLWKLYKQLPWGERYKIEMDTFEDSEKAVEVIKNWMDKGAVVFSHFTSDYSKFIVFRDEDTDGYILKAREEKSGKKK
jgi:hypothetical protein